MGLSGQGWVVSEGLFLLPRKPAVLFQKQSLGSRWSCSYGCCGTEEKRKKNGQTSSERVLLGVSEGIGGPIA